MERRESVFGRIFKFALNLTLREHRTGRTAEPRPRDRRSRRSAKHGAVGKKFWKEFTGLERLESRQMLSIAPADPNDAERPASALTSSAVISTVAGPNPPVSSLITTADAANSAHVQSAAQAPTNPSKNAPVDGSFRIEVRLVRSVGHGKGGHGAGHDDEPLAPSQSAGVGSGTAAPMVGYGSGSGGGPGSSGSAVLSVGTATAPEGGELEIPITITGASESWGVSWEADPEDADTGIIYRGYIPDFGDGTRYVSVPLQDDGPDNDPSELPVAVEVTSAVGPGVVDVVSHISETAQAYTSNASCDCGNVEAAPMASGRAGVNSGQGGDPEDLFYNGVEGTHPIVSVQDTLTNVPNDGNVVVQTALYDLSGSSTPVWASTPVYYN
ncbi:MAG TPA: hypothetical protein VFW87_22525, partial [Pirellulales bacterium]|nr:hypothetical protein [Pirellulales bacterium]